MRLAERCHRHSYPRVARIHGGPGHQARQKKGVAVPKTISTKRQAMVMNHANKKRHNARSKAAHGEKKGNRHEQVNT